MAKWKKIERIGVENFPLCLDDSDSCYFARDYISRGGYGASETNDLINNYKKPSDRKGRPEWRYKEQAIRTFARELAFISNIEIFFVTCVPSSKARTSLDYDSRLEDTIQCLKELKPGVSIGFPFSFRTDMLPAHSGGSRNVDEIYANLVWSGIPDGTKDIIIVDDVITTGAHYKACKRLILDHLPNANVHGLFWARTVWPEEDFSCFPSL